MFDQIKKLNSKTYKSTQMWVNSKDENTWTSKRRSGMWNGCGKSIHNEKNKKSSSNLLLDYKETELLPLFSEVFKVAQQPKGE